MIFLPLLAVVIKPTLFPNSNGKSAKINIYGTGRNDWFITPSYDLGASEQKKGVEQINTSVVELDKITQTNAGVAEETSATTHILAEKAEEFRNLVERFKLKKENKNSNKKIKEIER